MISKFGRPLTMTRMMERCEVSLFSELCVLPSFPTLQALPPFRFHDPSRDRSSHSSLPHGPLPFLCLPPHISRVQHSQPRNARQGLGEEVQQETTMVTFSHTSRQKMAMVVQRINASAAVPTVVGT
jgi:hypothetical protein